MTNRFLVSALAAVTIAVSAPSVAHADTGIRAPHVHAVPPGKIAALIRTETARGPRVQATSTT